MTDEEQRKQDAAHIAAAEANKNAQYLDLAETNRKLARAKEAAKINKRKMRGD